MTTLTTALTLPTTTDWQDWLAYGLAWAEVGLTTTTPTKATATAEPAAAAYPMPVSETEVAEAPAAEDGADLAWSSFIAPTASPGALYVGGPGTWTEAGRRRIALVGYREDRPGPRWQELHRATWPSYRGWYLSEGLAARPSLDECRAALAEHMPELAPVWEELVRLTGTDPVAARMLTMWRMPTYSSACSQVVLEHPQPLLVRNYDYDPALFEGVVGTTNYSARRRVLGTSDLLWGLLDGMNEDGLAVSLTCGGRRPSPADAPGFGIPLVIRYLLETCATVDEAIEALRRLPVAQAYTIALVDTRPSSASVFVAPGDEPVVSRLRATTNHRLDVVEDEVGAARLASVERQQTLLELTSPDGPPVDEDSLVSAFLRAPLRREDYARGFGTLYTAAYRPDLGEATYAWPGTTWRRGFDDGEDTIEAWVTQQ
ncbi:C45 family autoproteolytic acyltransferase/hydrolase [Actinomycetota bacterium]